MESKEGLMINPLPLSGKHKRQPKKSAFLPQSELYTRSQYAAMVKFEACRRFFYHFYKFMTDWDLPPHVLMMIERLQHLGTNERIIFSMPPRHAKSTTISQMFAIWKMGNAIRNKENFRVGYFTYGQRLSNENSYKSRQFVKSPYYELVYPSVVLDNENVEFWRFNPAISDVSFMASSVGGAATGLGYELLIIDDPIKNLEEADNRDYTEKIYDWFKSTSSTRLNKDANIIVVATRWSDHDLSGRLLEDKGWEHISFPAIDEHDNALWPEMFSKEKLNQIEEDMPPRIWRALYQQNPTPDEGTIFKQAYLKYAEKPAHLINDLISWDTASSLSETSAFSVGLEMGKDASGNIYIYDIMRRRMEFVDLLDTARDWGSSKNIYIEKKDSGVSLINSLKKSNFKRNVIPVMPKMSKDQRFESIIHKFRAGKVYFCGEKNMQEVISELLKYPEGKYRDCIDALSQGIWFLDNLGEIKTGVNREEILNSSPYANII